MREWEGGTLEIGGAFRRANYFFPGRLARTALSVVGALPGGYLLLKKGVDFIRRRKKASLQLTSAAGAASAWRLERSIEFPAGRILVRDRLVAGEGRSGVTAAIELETAADSLVTARPLGRLEDELSRSLRERGEATVEKELIFTSSGIEVTGKLAPG